MGRPDDPIFKSTTVTRPRQTGHDEAAIKTYRYLRLGMLVAVAVLVWSVAEEYFQPGVHCLLGSFSSYYYTPVHAVFISVMVAIGFALIVIKGRTAAEDASLSFAGMMAPLVAFIPTSEDPNGVCRKPMQNIGHYQPNPGSRFISASVSNNLHALVFAGYAALALVLVAFFIQWVRTQTLESIGTWINLAGGLVLVVTASILLHWTYGWVLQSHERAAYTMFAFLALAAGANTWSGFKQKNTTRAYAWTYGAVGAAMFVVGLVFVVLQHIDRSVIGGHLVLFIEAAEILLFVIFWSVQTVERWNGTV